MELHQGFSLADPHQSIAFVIGGFQQPLKDYVKQQVAGGVASAACGLRSCGP